MTASFQTPSGAPRPEASPLLEHSLCGARRPGYVLRKLPCVRDPHADSVHMDVHGVTWPATPVQAATGVIRASIEQGNGTPAGIAQAEADAGILFDPKRAEQIATAAREQAAAEYRAEIDDLREENASLRHFKGQLDAVRRVLAGHRGDDAMLVREILTATDGQNPLDGIPWTLAWNGGVGLPDGGSRHGRAIVECATSYGARADLVLTGDKRQALAALLDTEIVRDIHAQCPTDGCGAAEAEGASYPLPDGWARLEIAGDADGLRAYCSPMCVSLAFARAGEQLAAADRTAELDGGL
ncbi:hypothetical protein AB0903_33635 [Streptomyces sp. NPDC048389]|uniref:hypothetical protein n=1 Tax=Streptomyces sp. NPDC048389 TaxID=3154622 RepID=UPI003453419A